MKQIDVRADGIDERFSTNEDGGGFFIWSDGGLKQILSDSGYQNLRQMKKTIRDYLGRNGKKLPRLSYRIVGGVW